MIVGSITAIWKKLIRLDLFLGYGRALESFLIFVKFLYFCMFLFGSTLINQDPFFIAFSAIDVPDRRIFCIPFLMAWLPGFLGLYLNACANHNSKYYRILGASFGFTIWLFVLSENCLLGVYLAGVNPWVLAGMIASLWIIRRGLLDKPTPGLAIAEA